MISLDIPLGTMMGRMWESLRKRTRDERGRPLPWQDIGEGLHDRVYNPFHFSLSNTLKRMKVIDV
jgi:hypothetical protein